MSLRISELPSNLERQRLGLGSPTTALPALPAAPAVPALPAAPAVPALPASNAMPDVTPLEVCIISTVMLAVNKYSPFILFKIAPNLWFFKCMDVLFSPILPTYSAT